MVGRFVNVIASRFVVVISRTEHRARNPAQVFAMLNLPPPPRDIEEGNQVEMMEMQEQRDGYPSVFENEEDPSAQKPLLAMSSKDFEPPAPSFNCNAECAACVKFRSVNLTWGEKLFLWIEFFQLFAVIYIAAQSWPFPSQWQSRVSWTLFFNLDFPAFFFDSTFDYLYMLAFGLFPFALLISGLIAVCVIRCTVGACWMMFMFC